MVITGTGRCIRLPRHVTCDITLLYTAGPFARRLQNVPVVVPQNAAE